MSKKQTIFVTTEQFDLDTFIAEHLHYLDQTSHFKQAYDFIALIADDLKNSYDQSVIEQGLEMVEMLSLLFFDEMTLAAALIYPAVLYGDIPFETIEKNLNLTLAKKMDDIKRLNIAYNIESRQKTQLDNVRKMLLSMVKDVRIVVIKITERLAHLRAVRKSDEKTQRRLADETFNIFAPLANRLGLHQLKWRLEDLSFFYLHPDEYQRIAKALAERRLDREDRIERLKKTLSRRFLKENIKADIAGRSKHIYSIKRKMARKNVDFDQIYDATALRILVSTKEECYRALSIIHEMWLSIPEEFDDYVTNPKPNGYQSIHTALIDEQGKNFEVQIRTHQMHDDSERGVAAHWKYKEGKNDERAFEEKINWLRQLIDWQKTLEDKEEFQEQLEKNVFENHVYVFTPLGDIIDLPMGATPLDFAYHIHTEVGHRCRGAKINDKIVPLTTQLKTGDTVSILTTKISQPSRDWITPKRGYLKTATARAKVLHFFKQLDLEKHIETGKQLLETELSRLNLSNVNLNIIAADMNFKHKEGLYAALAQGHIRLSPLMSRICAALNIPIPSENKTTPIVITPQKATTSRRNVSILGMGDLKTRIAKCCKPLPGDPIIGYITQGEGITIHHQDCKNMIHSQKTHQERIIPAQWAEKSQTFYPVDVEITSFDRPGLMRDITTTLANEKINLLSINTHLNKKKQLVIFSLTLEIESIEALSLVLAKLQQIPNISTVKRVNEQHH